MKRLEHLAFLVIVALLVLLLAIFPFLTLDAVGKLVSRQGGLEPGNFVLVLYLELSRALTTVVALLAVISLVLRSSRQPDGRALALFFVFTALTYEKIFGGISYPGPLQEKLTLALLGAGVPRSALLWLFGPVPWSLWLALAALMRFSVVFPRPPLSAAAINASGEQDRRGMLRGAGVAGLDIGAGFRAISKRGLALGAFRPLPIWSTAVALMVITSMSGPAARLVLFATAATLVTALVITNLRASYNVVAEIEKARMRWLVLGFSAGGALFLIASLPLLFFDDPFVTVPALVLLMVAPAVVMTCMALAVLYRGPADAAQMLERIPGLAALSFIVLLVFSLATTLLRTLAQSAGISPALALLAALVLTGLLVDPLRKISGRAVDRVLERTER